MAIVSLDPPVGLSMRDHPSRGAIAPDLAGVPETTLWALHDRAGVPRRRDGVLVDPGSVRIHDVIDYGFAHHFGDPVGSLAFRAAEIDRVEAVAGAPSGRVRRVPRRGP